jgi:DNA-directed RNA polymerase subunit RPC12/RpoP
MTTGELTCSHCGAAIEVAATARFAACVHCGAQLAIHRTPAGTFTEIVQQVRTQAAGTALDLERAQLRHELEKIDLAWQMRRRHLVGGPEMSRDEAPAPGQISPIAAGVAIVAALLVIAGLGLAGGRMSWITGPLAVLVVFGGSLYVRNAGSARKTGAQLAYERERAEILRRLEALTTAAPPEAARVPIAAPTADAPPAERVTVEALTTACAQCGGPVTVAPDAQVVSCRHCGARLAVHRTPDACYTEVIERIQAQAVQAAGDVEELNAQSRQLGPRAGEVNR